MEQSTNSQQYETIALRLKVFLQACYNADTNTMATTMHQNAGLPANQPYSASPWHYEGGEVLNTDDPELVDWMLIELYAGGFIRGQVAALLRSNGNLVDTDGNLSVRIKVDKQIPSTAVSDMSPLPDDSYYLVVRHRNHLAIRSNYPLNFGQNNGEMIVNLSFDSGNCHCDQEYTSTVRIGSTWCMRAGDVTSDGQVKVNGPENDQNALVNNSGLSGSLSAIVQGQYNNADVNMDGVIKQNGPDNDLDFLVNKTLGGSLSKTYKAQL